MPSFRKRSDSGAEPESASSTVAPSKRNKRSGQYPRTQLAEPDADEDAIFASLSSDIEAAVSRMQQRLEQDGAETLQDTAEISPVRGEAGMPSARFKRDGSVVPAPRTSVIRELEHAEDFDDGHTEIDDGSNFDDGHTEIDQIGRHGFNDSAEFDEAVEFHEGPTGASSRHWQPREPSETEERMHPWFDSALAHAPAEQSEKPAFVTRRLIASEIPPGTMSSFPRPPASGAADVRAWADSPRENARHSTSLDTRSLHAVRKLLDTCTRTTLEVNLGHLLIGLGGLTLFVLTAYIAWLIASP